MVCRLLKTFSFLCESLRAAAAAVRHGRTPWCPHQTVRKARSPSPDLYCNKKHYKPGGQCQEKFCENVFIQPGGREFLRFSPIVSAYIGDKQIILGERVCQD